MLFIALIRYFLALTLMIKAINANVIILEDYIMPKGVFRFGGH